MKFKRLSKIRVFKFAFGFLFSYHTAFKMHEMQSQEISWGNTPPEPLEARATGARLVCPLIGSHPPVKKPSNAPEIYTEINTIIIKLHIDTVYTT